MTLSQGITSPLNSPATSPNSRRHDTFRAPHTHQTRSFLHRLGFTPKTKTFFSDCSHLHTSNTTTISRPFCASFIFLSGGYILGRIFHTPLLFCFPSISRFPFSRSLNAHTKLISPNSLHFQQMPTLVFFLRLSFYLSVSLIIRHKLLKAHQQLSPPINLTFKPQLSLVGDLHLKIKTLPATKT